MAWPSEAQHPDLPLIDLYWTTGAFVIVSRPTGIQYTNQTGGNACRHPCLEGFVVPIECDEENPGAVQRRLTELFEGPVWQGGGARGEGISEDDAAYIDAALYQPPGWNISVDRSRLSDSDEAWVWVELHPSERDPDFPLFSRMTPPITGVLSWTNSD